MKVDVNSSSMRIIKTLSRLKISEVALGKLERLAAKLGIDEEQFAAGKLNFENFQESVKDKREEKEQENRPYGHESMCNMSPYMQKIAHGDNDPQCDNCQDPD